MGMHMQDLRIVDVELVDGAFIGVHLSDNTAILISAAQIFMLDLPRFTILLDESPEPSQGTRHEAAEAATLRLQGSVGAP